MHSIIRRVLLACTENIPYTAINVVYNKVSNSVVRKIIKYIHVSRRSLKKKYRLLVKWIFAVMQDF